MRGSHWMKIGQGWQAAESELRLTGWSRARRVVVLRRQIPKNLAVVRQREQEPLQLSFAELTDDDVTVYEYSVLVTSLGNEMLSVAQLYRDRADAENNFDELKNHCTRGHKGMGRLYHPRHKTLPIHVSHHGLNLQLVELIRPACRPSSTYRSHHQPPVDALRHWQTNTPCRTNPFDHQQSTRGGRKSGTALPQYRRLLQRIVVNCGAVDALTALVPHPEFSTGKIPSRATIAAPKLFSDSCLAG